MDSFFKPTPLFKEYLLLEAIEKNSKITQRELSRILSVALSMINGYLDKAEHDGYVTKKYNSTKDVEYIITHQGVNRRKLLNVTYLKSAQSLYNFAKGNILNFLFEVSKSVNDLILYGAGEVAEILINTINDHPNLNIDIIAIIDDNPQKVGQSLVGIPIISRNDLSKYNPDGVLISAYGMYENIYQKLVDVNFDQKKIYHFFN